MRKFNFQVMVNYEMRLNKMYENYFGIKAIAFKILILMLHNFVPSISLRKCVTYFLLITQELEFRFLWMTIWSSENHYSTALLVCRTCNRDNFQMSKYTISFRTMNLHCKARFKSNVRNFSKTVNLLLM